MAARAFVISLASALVFASVAPAQQLAPLRSRQRTGAPVLQAAPPDEPFWGGRVRDGLAAYYPLLGEPGGADHSGAGLDLTLSGDAARLEGRNGLRFDDGAAKAENAAGLRDAIVAAQQFSVEVWAKADSADHGGPARLVTFSQDPWNRNFLLSADGADLHIRLRTTTSDDNGAPYFVIPDAVSDQLEHYVLTFAEGVAKLYRNGELLAEDVRGGDLSNWDSSFALALGNEPTNDRHWHGEMYVAALYARALNPIEIRRNFQAGDNPAQSGSTGNQAPDVDAGADRTIVAPADTLTLDGTVADEGAPTVQWSMRNGPGEAVFADSANPRTAVRFSQPGDYELELVANDGQLAASDVVRVRLVANQRVGDGLVAFYPLSEGAGARARNQIGGPGPDLDLSEGARWLEGRNGIRLSAEARLQSPSEAAGLRDALVATNAFTVELWVRPDHQNPESRARLWTLSDRSWGDRNLTLSQDQEGLHVALRTSRTREDGRTSRRAPRAFTGGAVQVAATYDGERLRMLVNGEVAFDDLYPGDLSNWSSELPLVLGGEIRGDGGWSGELYLAAVYNRALSAPELRRNFLVTDSLLDGGAPVANDAPQALAGDDRLIAMPRDSVTLRAHADDDGLPGPTAYQWSKLEGPGDVSFSDASALRPTARFSAPGLYTLELAATDGQFTMRDVVEVAVAPQWAPRLLDQATWGGRREDLERLIRIGPDEFLTEQLTARPSEFPEDEIGGLRLEQDRFYSHALNNPDQLRQRMVFALSKIFVVSANAVGRRDQMVPYLRLLNEHAFGNVLELLRDITLNPTMGQYLDMVNNAAFSEDNPIPPNENYARELLQLFTTGTELLEPDGTPRIGPDGQPIPAYSEEDVRQFTRALTGWTYPTRAHRELRWPNAEYYGGEMEPVEDRHDRGEKRLLNGVVLPEGQTARQDMERALRNLFNHSNMGPFLGKQLIQQLVTSDPSPAYVARVAAAFDDNGSGERGDLAAVLRAILLDPEAHRGAPAAGRLREPVHFQLALLRGLGALATPENGLAEHGRDMGQWVLYPPSVFSYFSPSYRIPGSGALAPEFQIHTKANALARADFAFEAARNRVGYGVSVELPGLMAVGDDLDRLCDALDADLFLGRMTDEVRQAVREAAEAADNTRDRVRNAVFVAASSAEFQVQH